MIRRDKPKLLPVVACGEQKKNSYFLYDCVLINKFDLYNFKKE